jgi:hypothetical protein
VILNQNDFQYKETYFKPTKGIAMVSPISSTLAEIYLQFFEEPTIRLSMQNGEISYYNVDDINHI